MKRSNFRIFPHLSPIVTRPYLPYFMPMWWHKYGSRGLIRYITVDIRGYLWLRVIDSGALYCKRWLYYPSFSDVSIIFDPNRSFVDRQKRYSFRGFVASYNSIFYESVSGFAVNFVKLRIFGNCNQFTPPNCHAISIVCNNSGLQVVFETHTNFISTLPVDKWWHSYKY